MSGTGKTELKGLETEKNLGSILDITRSSSLIYLTRHEGQEPARLLETVRVQHLR